MSEKEILKDLEKYIELINKEYCDECNELNVISGKYCNGSRNVAIAIQGLLDLYQKEKEKNEELKILIEQNLKYSHNLEKDLFENCSNYVISKDKIKEKIQELLKKGEQMTEEKRQTETEFYQGKLKALEELLEEE